VTATSESATPSLSTRPRVGALAAIAAWLLGGFLSLLGPWIVACGVSDGRSQALDDAYITFVYGRNLAEGYGLRFNPGDPAPVEGFSTTLHVLLAAAAHGLGWNPLATTRAANLLLLCLVPWLLCAGLRFATQSPWAIVWLTSATAGFGRCLLPETTWHATAGMETILFVTCHVAAIAWTLAMSGRTDRLWPPLALAAGLLALLPLILCRPEGLPLAVAYLLAIPLARGLLARRPLAPLAWWWTLLSTGLAVTGWLWWKQQTFGGLLPTAYLVKSHNAIFGSSGVSLPGLDIVVRFVAMRCAPLLVLVLAVTTWIRMKRRGRLAIGLLLLPSLLVTVAYARAIHETAGAFRYEFPMLVPALAILALLALRIWSRSPRGFPWLLAALLALGVLATPHHTQLVRWASAPRSSAVKFWNAHLDDHALARLGLDLADTVLGRDATILLSGAGFVPYYSRFRSIDWIGLNTARFCGREPLTIGQMWREIEAERPDVVYSILPPASEGVSDPTRDAGFQSPSVQRTLQGRGSQLFMHWNRDRVAEFFWHEMRFVRDHCEFGAAYHLGGALGNDWMLIAYVRKNSPHRARLLGVLQTSERADRVTDLAPFYGNDPRALK
jgi:hypothetical protein